MEDPDLLFTEPIASTSRAVFTLPYKPPSEPQAHSLPSTIDPVRVKLYEEAWTICHERIQSTLASLHDASLDRIVNFVRSSPLDNEPIALYTALTGGKVPLKTGLILGASPGSSSLIYSSLIRQLVHPSGPALATGTSLEPIKPVLVSRLTSRECSNIKNALRSLIAGFVGSDADLEVDEEDEEDEAIFAQQRNSTLKSTLMVPEDVQNLVAWYEYKYGKKDKDRAPTLVVLLEDLEAVDGKVLNQLVATLSHYTTTLPLVLLLGVATTSTALYNLIPQQTTNLLDISQFFVDPGIGAFNALVRGVFVEFQPPLSLGPRAYTELYRSFEDLHHSIDSTITYLQYLYMNHFLTSPLASLLSLTLPSSSASTIDPADLSTTLSSVPSLSSDPQTIETILGIKEELDQWTKERSEAFEALLIIMDFWDKRRPLEVCLNLLLGTLGGGGTEGGRGGAGMSGIKKVVDEMCGLILQASSTKLPNFLRTVVSRLTIYSTSHPEASTSLLEFVRNHLEQLDLVLSKPKPSGRSNLINVHLAGGVGTTILPGFGEMAGRTSSGVSEVDREFSKIAKEVSDGLRDRLKSALRPCSEVKGYEVFYSEDTSASKRLNPSPLPTIMRTLVRLDPLSTNTSFAINSSGSSDQIELIPLDLAIAYRIYKDLNSQGRLINLGDWWSGFELGAGDEPETSEGNGAAGKKDKNGKKRRRIEEAEEEDEEDDDEDEDDQDGPMRRKQARFLRAVADLAHLGFVHPTTRKPEHLLKSVY